MALTTASSVRQYITGVLSLSVGAQHAYIDLAPVNQQDGYGYSVAEFQLASQTSGDTGNAYHNLWLSVKATPRTTYLIGEGIPSDIIALRTQIRASEPVVVTDVATQVQGIMIGRPVFVQRVRLGVSGSIANCAGAPVTVGYKLGLDLIKLDAALMTEIYFRAGT